MKVKFVHTLLVAAAFVSAAGAFVSCKDYESDDIQEIRNQYANATALSQDLSNKLGKAEDDITVLRNRLDTIKSCNCTDYSDAIASLQSTVGTLKDKADSLYQAGHDPELGTWTQAIRNLNNTLTNNYATKEQLRNSVDSLNGALVDLKADLLKNIARGDSLNRVTTEHYADSLYYLSNSALKDSMFNVRAEEAKINQRVDVVAGTIDEVKDGVLDLVSQLITGVLVQGTYAPAFGSLALPLDIQSNMLVTYYGTNQAGNYEFPTRTATKFYDAADAEGLTAKDISSNSKVSLTDGETLLDNEAGNLGTLYLTVNPTNINASGLKFDLENSNGEPSKITLEPATPYNETMTWGYTRGAEENGNNVYAVKATLNKDDINSVRANIDRSEVVAAVKNVVKDRQNTKSDLKTLARKVAQFAYENANTELPRLGVATQYTLGNTKLGTKTVKRHVVSKLDILATAFKPAGFGALDNVSVSGVPGLERAENSLVNFINNFKIGKIHITDHIDTIAPIKGLGKIEISRNGKDYYIDVNTSVTITVQPSVDPITIDQWVKYNTYKQVNGQFVPDVDSTHVYQKVTPNVKPVTVTQPINVKVKINDTIDQLLGTVSTSIQGNLDNMEASINAFNNNIDDINALIKELNDGVDIDSYIVDTKQNVINRVERYLSSINNRFAYWFNRISGSALKPVLLLDDGKAVHRVTAAGITVPAGTYWLVPTTYTYELLAPAYKKYVHIYNTKTGADVFNGIINGNDHKDLKTNFTTKGTYRVVYEAVDYNGKVVARTYTITVK